MTGQSIKTAIRPPSCLLNFDTDTLLFNSNLGKPISQVKIQQATSVVMRD